MSAGSFRSLNGAQLLPNSILQQWAKGEEEGAKDTEGEYREE